jgi:hypothetical protein
MDEEETGGLSGGSPKDGSLQDEMAHWVEVLDRWIKRVDVGMDGRLHDTAAADGDGPDQADGNYGIDGEAETSDPAADVEG